ncbi:MAG: nucleotidyl transferase AbiEii/AbiGii toxin family protein [Sphingobacteriia bacterium]|nr:nucleotidyl transferase AbiEii/AbiGii toxin family protein [Sphingobacteriia bacterium]
MKLHENIELYNDVIVATAQMIGLPEIYVEKDYWVTVALHTIFTSEVGLNAVFKGGTALSKCFSVIDRFSEDIDIVLLKEDIESGNLLKTRLKKISETVAAILPEIDVASITKKFGMIRKTAHTYQHHFSGQFGQIRDIIILETTWLRSYEHYTTAMVSSFVVDKMSATSQSTLVEEYDLQPFQVNILSRERTLCEKIMSLVRFSFTPDSIADLNNKVRHIYGIHKLLSMEYVRAFLDSTDFESMLLKVSADDIISFKNNNEWLANHTSTAILFSDAENTWKQIKNTYFTTFAELVYGELPTEAEILRSIDEVDKRLKDINWLIA